MKYKITFESLLDYFVDDYNWFKILNNYVLFARNSAGKVFSINSDVFTFHMTTTDFLYSVTWHTPAFGSNSQVSIKEIADNALRTAISKVKDGEQIIVDTIPLGELYLE